MLFRQRSHVALDRNLGTGYNTLPLRLIQGDPLGACPLQSVPASFGIPQTLWSQYALFEYIGSFRGHKLARSNYICTTITYWKN